MTSLMPLPCVVFILLGFWWIRPRMMGIVLIFNVIQQVGFVRAKSIFLPMALLGQTSCVFYQKRHVRIRPLQANNIEYNHEDYQEK